MRQCPCWQTDAATRLRGKCQQAKPRSRIAVTAVQQLVGILDSPCEWARAQRGAPLHNFPQLLACDPVQLRGVAGFSHASGARPVSRQAACLLRVWPRVLAMELKILQ